MAADTQSSVASNLTAAAEGTVSDLQKLIAQHFDLLRSEMKQGLTDAKDAAVSISTGAGSIALAGALGTLAVVHLLQRITRLPLWACYGLVAGGLGAAGTGMVCRGARQAREVDLLPRQTAEVLKQEFTGSTR
jgi:hypothetical protein